MQLTRRNLFKIGAAGLLGPELTPLQKAPATLPADPKTWQAAIGLHLAKVPEVDAVFVSTGKGTIHVYSVVEDIKEDFYDQLLKEENLIEKEFPGVEFEFHTRAHQGRKPTGDEEFSSELVFLRQ
jgi:hypothetical protein